MKQKLNPTLRFLKKALSLYLLVLYKFILIGDHKQLPAVVLQPSSASEVKNPLLRAIGLTNLKDSLFERLYRSQNSQISMFNSPFCDMLTRQGRMHPDVARFANDAFYEGKLQPVGLPHQIETLNWLRPISSRPGQTCKHDGPRCSRNSQFSILNCLRPISSRLGQTCKHDGPRCSEKSQLEKRTLSSLLRSSPLNIPIKSTTARR